MSSILTQKAGALSTLFAMVQGQILTLVQSWWPTVMLLEGAQVRWQKPASQLLALAFSASAAARGGCAGALLSQPRSDAAGPDRSSFLWTEAALCTWALLGTWVIDCLFIFPKHPPVLLVLGSVCSHRFCYCLELPRAVLGFCATSSQ